MQVSSSSGSENTYTNAAYSNKGISGMNSGLDTESLVKSMMNDIQTKIDKQEQKQKVLEMQQEQYRDVIDKINEFKDKYFSVTGEKSLVLSSTFNTTTTESSSTAVKVSSTSDAVEGSFDVEVKSLATQAKITGVSVGENNENLTVEVGGQLKQNQPTMMALNVGGTSINVDISGAASASDMAERINKGVTSYNREHSTSYEITASVGSDGKLKLSGSGAGSGVTVDGGTASSPKDAEITSGKVTADTSAYDDTGKTYTFKVNNQKVTVNVAKDSDLAETLKTALANNGVSDVKWDTSGEDKKLVFTGSDNKLTLEAEEGYEADFKELGFSSKQEASRTSEVSVDVPEIESKGKLSVTFNGVSKNIALTSTDTVDSLNDKLYDAFGSGIHFNTDDNGKITLTAGAGKTIKVGGDSSALQFIGMDDKGATNQVNTSMTLKEVYGYNDDDQIKFSINGTNFSFTGNTKLSDMMSEINESRAGVTLTYNSLNDKFSITGQEMGSGSMIQASDISGGLINNMFGTSTINKQGEDAKVVIDGEEVTYSGNELKYNGVNITLKSVGTANIETSRDNDKTLETIVSFVEDYNALIKDLNDRTHEKAEYKQYMPLTDAQKDEMSESEIKKWEEKTNKGLLSGDKDISSFLSEMRSVLYTKVGDSKLLSEIGIESSSDWKDYGKLTVDKDKLKDAIQNDMNSVKKIFTGDNGICSRLESACKKVANTSSGSPGSLVSLAGIKGKATEKNNTINKRIDSIKDVITKLKAQYDSRKERLWKQFNSMETALGNMNSTANYFASMMGGGY